MNKKYKENLNYIKKLSVDLFNKIEKTDANTATILKNKNKENNIVKQYNGSNILIHSSYDPRRQASFIADKVCKFKYDIVFMFGFGLGYELEAMLKKDNDKRYFVVEPDADIFKKALECIDIKILSNNNIYFIQDDRYENIATFLQSLIENDKSINIKFVVSPAYEVIYKDLINKLNEFITKLINVFTVNLHTNIVHQRQWFQNYIANLKYLVKTCSVSELEQSFRDKPAIIVGAGPSLNYNLDHLRKVADKAIIVGAGTGLTMLEKNNIKANLAGAIDGSKLEEKLFENLVVNKNTALFYSTNVYYTVPNKLDGEKFLMNVTHMDELINKELKLENYMQYSSASISIILANNLARLGCNPIILLGQDFCYSNNKIYADGVEDIKGNNTISKDFNNDSSFSLVRNKNNELVYTNKAFLSMKSLMENCIELNPNTEFINGTKDGLEIVGARDIDFNSFSKEVLESCMDTDIEKYIHDVYLESTRDEKSDIKMELIKRINVFNKEIIDICNKILLFIEEEGSIARKIEFANERERTLKNNLLYDIVVSKLIDDIEYIFKNKEKLDYFRSKYSYILDKCLIMENAFEYEVYGGESENDI